MTENFKNQIKWFALLMLDLRFKTDGYHTPIVFNISEIQNSTHFSPRPSTRNAQKRTRKMLEEIRGFLMANNNGAGSGAQFSCRPLGRGRFEISGYTTALLRKYLREALHEHTGLLSEMQDSQGKAVIAYMGQKTEVKISGDSIALFREFRRHPPGQPVTYNDLFEALKRSKGGMAAEFAERYNNDTEKRAAVQTGIGNLIKKLNEAVPSSPINGFIENRRGVGYTMLA